MTAAQHTPTNGREANEQGFYEHQCPFPSDSCEADQWRQEWSDAQIDREMWEDENFHSAKAEGSASCGRCGSEMKGRAGDFGFCGECNAEIDDHDD